VARRLALLVATYRYEDAGLRQLAAPEHDAEALAEVLRNREIAGFDVTVLVNKPYHVVGKAIGEFYRNRRRDDLMLLYFTGHGLKDDDGRLYLAMADTERDDLLFTALSAQQIDDAMEACSSRQRVLVLDCCYSGAFPTGRISKADLQVHTLEKFQGKGRVVLTASDAIQYSFEGNKITREGTREGLRSVFTGFLVEGLTTGEADLDGDGDISLDELYSYVYDRVTEEMPQQRPKKQENIEGRIVIARNINWSLPVSVRNAIESPIAGDRLAVLESLAHLHRVGNDLVRIEVINQTRRLSHDDSKAVSAAAMKLITALNPERTPLEAEEQVQEHTEEQAQLKTDRWTASPWASKPMRRSYGERAPRDVEGPDARQTKVRGYIGLADSWGLGRLTRNQVVFTALAVLVIISLVVVPVVVDTRSGVVTIPVGVRATGVAVAPDGRHAYIANSSNVSVIDTASNAVTATIPVGTNPRDVEVAPDGHHAYVSNSSNVSVIDIVGNVVTATIPVGAGPRGIALNPGGNHAYVANINSDNVSVIDLASNIVTATISVGASPRGVAVVPSGRHAYVTNTGSRNVSVIDTASNKVTATIPVGNIPWGVAVAPDGRHAYVTNTSPNSVSVIDTTSNTVTANIPTDSVPRGVAVAPGGRHTYVTNTGSNSVSVIDTTSNTVTANIPVGANPLCVAVAPDGHHAYITNTDSDNVSVIEIDTG
jgi:YVTN family beta-propeller protein